MRNNKLKVIYLNIEVLNGFKKRKWNERRVGDDDAKFINIEEVEKLFQGIIEDEGLFPSARAAIKAKIQQLKEMING